MGMAAQQTRTDPGKASFARIYDTARLRANPLKPIVCSDASSELTICAYGQAGKKTSKFRRRSSACRGGSGHTTQSTLDLGCAVYNYLPTRSVFVLSFASSSWCRNRNCPVRSSPGTAACAIGAPGAPSRNTWPAPRGSASATKQLHSLHTRQCALSLAPNDSSQRQRGTVPLPLSRRFRRFVSGPGRGPRGIPFGYCGLANLAKLLDYLSIKYVLESTKTQSKMFY